MKQNRFSAAAATLALTVRHFLIGCANYVHAALFVHMARTGLVRFGADEDHEVIVRELKRIGDQAAALKEPYKELKARVEEIEMRQDRGPGGGGGDVSMGFDLAGLLEKSGGFAALKSKNTPTCRIELPAGALASKAATTSTTAGITALVQPDRRTGILIPGQRRMTIRNLLVELPTDAGSVEYVREVSVTNGAAPVAEAALKPQTSVTLELLNAKIITIAHWAHASKQILDDVPQLANYLDSRLRYGLQNVEEMQLLMGSGTGENLGGLYTLATAYSPAFTPTGATQLDTLRLAMLQLEESNYQASAFVLHPRDWAKVELIKNNDGDYIKANPNENGARVLWGRPVVTTTAMAMNKFLVGDFPQAAVLYDRQEATLDIATMDQDDFVRNLIKLRVEERVGLAVQLPAALVKGDVVAQ